MLAIRLQRHGRKAYPVYRVIVQEAQRHPSSGRIVAHAGTYNPHTKQVNLVKDVVEKYLKTGAQPSPRVIRLLQAEKISLPDWVKLPDTGNKRSTRNPDKLRKNQPKEESAEPAPEASEEAEATEA